MEWKLIKKKWQLRIIFSNQMSKIVSFGLQLPLAFFLTNIRVADRTYTISKISIIYHQLGNFCKH